MRYFTFLLFFVLFSANQVTAGEIKEIEMNDGSILFGEIISLNRGVYVIKSTSLGNIEINNSTIKSINPVEATKEQYQALQQEMLNDKEILAIILTLQDDPDVVDILNNPDVMKEITDGNITALISSPDFMKLLDNPKFLEIRRMITKEP